MLSAQNTATQIAKSGNPPGHPPVTLTAAAGYTQVGKTYTAHLSKHMHLDGKPFEVLGASNTTEFDPDTFGPMYRIKFECGTEIDAWPEEVEVPVDQVSDRTLFQQHDRPRGG